MLLYLAKKLRSIGGHKECEEGYTARLGLCEVGGWGGGVVLVGCGCAGVINGKHYLTN